MPSPSDLQEQARSILDSIAFTPFERCQPLSRDFSSIPATEPPYNVQIPTEQGVMQTKSLDQLTANDADVILARLPERIREALVERATEIEYPIEAVVEMAFGHAMLSANASFLDTEALSFVDCKPGRGQ